MVQKYINVLLDKLTFSNLFNVCPPFQIDGNFGGTAAMAESLLQSHKGYIELLPSLPTKWVSGKIIGLKARGNFEVSIEWADSKMMRAVIKSNSNSICKVKYDRENIYVKDVNYEIIDNEIIEFKAFKDQEYIILCKE